MIFFKRKIFRNCFSWGLRPITEDFLSIVVEEAYCLVKILYRMMSTMLPKHLLSLFEEKCLEAVIPNASRPPPAVFLTNGKAPFRSTRRGIATPLINSIVVPNASSLPRQLSDASTQTFSTGEINVLSVYYDN